MRRVVVFTSDLNYSVRKGLVHLLDEASVAEALVMIHRPPRRIERLIVNQWRNLKKHGWRWIPHQTAEVLSLIAGKLRRRQWHSSSVPGNQYSLEALAVDSRVSIRCFHDIHGPEAVAAVQLFKPDLGISLAAPILKRSLFGVPKMGTVNLHKGKVPQYRGMPPAFWELWNDEKSVGCTVHFVNDTLDTGDVVITSHVRRLPYSTPQGLRLELDETGIRLVTEAVNLIYEGRCSAQPQSGQGATHTKPTLRQIAQLRRRLNPVDVGTTLREWAKASVSNTYRFGVRPIVRAYNRATSRRETVILLYHRVSDEFRDGVTVGIEQFDRHMNFIASRYPVASLEDIVHDRLPAKTNGKPVIAVTFDDGYRDNYDNALPILLRYGIPAGFFVSTGMIDEQRGFDHDFKKLGRGLPNMSWDQLRKMHQYGFTIGSHTVTHLNCAKARRNELVDELVESKARLECELGLEEVYFAYPFGGRDDITSEALREIVRLGYSACFSAYGGVNIGAPDPFNILRFGVSSGFHFSRFAARLEGW